MNIKEYISSGIIESYVLGLASADERVEFEQLCRQYPELVAARDAFEVMLEKQLMLKSSVAPISMKQKVLENIQATDAKVVAIDDGTAAATTTRKISPLRWVAAASVLLLLGATYFAYTFYNKNQQLQVNYQDLQSRMSKMEEEKKWMDEVQQMMSNPNVAVVNLVGTTPAKASADIYWDTTQASNVYLVVKNMPQLPTEKQYQLWSLLNTPDGNLKPTSMGLFDVGKDGKVILKMSNTQNADAFAITIEKRGNTGGPDMNQVQSMGKTRL